MIADDRYTLYADAGFVLVSLPENADEQQFWDNLSEQIRRQSGGATTISLPANSRILRVLQMDEHGPCAFHYAIIRVRPPHSNDIRLQPIIAWMGALGNPAVTVPMNADRALPRLDDIETRLKTAAERALVH